MTEPYTLTTAEAAAQMASGKLSPVALMESLLARVRSMEPDLKVWATLDEDAALDAAAESERELRGHGPRGLLHGVPVGIKDIYYTRGVETSAGSPIYADFVPDFDATPVARLKQAGAIIMGKTVTTEFASFDPPSTRNPWDSAHTPGGSSSGSAVGVAVGMFPAAVGSQTAGSVLRPAAYNGVVGLKPTFGLISRYGVFPAAWSLDTMGTFSRTVEDAALLLGVLAGHDSKDPSSSRRPAIDYRKAIDSWTSTPRIGLFRQFFYDRSTDEVRRHTDRVVAKLERAGAVVEEIRVPTDFATLLSAHWLVMSVETAAFQHGVFSQRPDDYAPKVRSVIEMGTLAPAMAYVQAQRIRRRFRRAMEEAIRGFDLLLTPTTPSPAPRDLTTTGDPMFQSPWTTCALPTITVPSGLSESGMPLGVQLVAAAFAEETLLAAARWCERVLDVSLLPPVH